MGISGILTQAVGIIGLGLVGYDSHKTAMFNSAMTTKEAKSNSLTRNYMEDLSIDSPSVVKQRVREGLFRFNLEENVSGFFTSIFGYVKGFVTMVMHNIIPTALALGALIKNPASKLCAAGLVLFGGMCLFQEIFGTGKAGMTE